jgi:hypothetical protein
VPSSDPRPKRWLGCACADRKRRNDEQQALYFP